MAGFPPWGPGLTAICHHDIETSTVSLDVGSRTIEQRREWRRHYSAQGKHRLLVAQDENCIRVRQQQLVPTQ